MESVRGIDVSKWQGSPNFVRVRAAGIRYVMLKATEGVGYTDPCFHANIRAAQAAGLPVGAYHFLRAGSAADQARDFLAALKPYCISWPAAVDVEHSEAIALGRGKLTDLVLDFCARVRAAGYQPMVYASYNWLYGEKHLDADRIRAADIPVWMAWYTDSNRPDNTDRSGLCDLWQYASDGKVDGVDGNVDLNVSYRDFGTVRPEAVYRVRTDGRWLPPVRGSTDFAGLSGRPITDLALRVTEGTVRYRVHIPDRGWLPYVTGCGTADSVNGYAGCGRPIDAVEILFAAPPGSCSEQRIRYRVSPVGGGYWPWQRGGETTGGQDGYAGLFGRRLDRLQITIDAERRL